MKTTVSTVKVWDPFVRLGHWVVVAAFFTAYFTEDDLLTQHVWAGYVVGAVVVLRVIWGIIGTRHARFSDFVTSPARTVRYLAQELTGRAARYLGHNPAGGAMIVALLAALAVTVYSGLMLYAIEEGKGPLAEMVAQGQRGPTLALLEMDASADDDHETEEHGRRGGEREDEFWEEVHEAAANTVLGLVGLHVAGVLFSGLAHRENLVKAMITGRKRAEP